MLRPLICIGCAAVFSGSVFGQATEAGPKFETADVHVSATGPYQYLRGGFYTGGRFEMHYATMVALIENAWDVDPDKVLGGPAWVTKDMFDVIAKAPANTPPETTKLMLQTLLADRFKLAVRQETKPMPAFVLSLGKGKPKMKESDGSGEPGCRPEPRTAPLEPGEIPQIHYSCRNVTMDTFVTLVHNYAGGYLTSPAVNSTGLSGSWDFDLTWTARGGLVAAGSAGISLFDAIDKQLGMKMEPKDVPTPVIQIVSVNEKPTDNPPGAADKTPAPATEFEVATIKPTDPKASGQAMNSTMLESGRLSLNGMTLRNLIAVSWQVYPQDSVVGGPKSLDSAHWDILAKAPTPVLAEGAKPIGIPFDYGSLMLMMQALLKDRFKLQLHSEDRQMNGYALVADKPKLRKTADPAARPECKEGPGPDGKDPRVTNPDASRLVTCLNMTVGAFAAELRNQASGYLYQYPPVVDATGIEGNYDFTINFSGAGALNRAGRGGVAAVAPGADTAAAEPSGVITLFEALEKQLGLKLESRKVTGTVMVIDHAEDAPIEN